MNDNGAPYPGAPQEKRAHERMHRTLKRRAVKPVQRTCASQQRRFDAFRLEYNTERPHDALGGDAGVALCRLVTAVSRAAPRARVSWALPRETGDGRGRAREPTHRVRGDRRRCVVTYLSGCSGRV